MVQTKLTFLSWIVHPKANHCRKFTKLKLEDTKCKHGRPYWICIPLFVLTTGNLGRGYGSWQKLKFKSHQRMHVEFISNNVDVMTLDCLSSVALALINQEAIIAYKVINGTYPLKDFRNHGVRYQIQVRNSGDLRIPLYGITHSQRFFRYWAINELTVINCWLINWLTQLVITLHFKTALASAALDRQLTAALAGRCASLPADGTTGAGLRHSRQVERLCLKVI